jgi:hypothetical protein
VLPELQVFREILEPPVLLVFKATKARQVLVEFKEQLELLEQRV